MAFSSTRCYPLHNLRRFMSWIIASSWKLAYVIRHSKFIWFENSQKCDSSSVLQPLSDCLKLQKIQKKAGAECQVFCWPLQNVFGWKQDNIWIGESNGIFYELQISTSREVKIDDFFGKWTFTWLLRSWDSLMNTGRVRNSWPRGWKTRKIIQQRWNKHRKEVTNPKFNIGYYQGPPNLQDPVKFKTLTEHRQLTLQRPNE